MKFFNSEELKHQSVMDLIFISPTSKVFFPGSKLFISSGRSPPYKFPIINKILEYTPEYPAKVVLSGSLLEPSEKELIFLCSIGDLNTLILLRKRGIAPGRAGFNSASVSGQLKILKWMNSYEGWLPTRANFLTVCRHNSSELLLWVYSKIGKYPQQVNLRDSADLAAASGQIENLKILASLDPSGFPTVYGANKAAANGHLEVLKWMEPRIFPDVNGANKAAVNGHLEVLKWLGGRILPDTQHINLTCSGNNLDILKYLATLKLFPTVSGANEAATYGQFEILIWLADLDPPILPNWAGVSEAVAAGHQKIALWLIDKGIEPITPASFWSIVKNNRGNPGFLKMLLTRFYQIYRDTLLARTAVDSAAEFGDLELLKFLTSWPESPGSLQTFPPSQTSTIFSYTTHSANRAAGAGHQEVLNWGSQLTPPVFPDVVGAVWAAESGHLEVLKWLASFKIFPYERGPNTTSKVEILDFLAPRILPNVEGAYYAARKGDLKLIKWMASRSPPILPSQQAVNELAGEGELTILKFLAGDEAPESFPRSFVLLPGVTGADLAAKNGHFEVLKWLASRKVFPFGAGHAALNGHLDILKWLFNQGIFLVEADAIQAFHNGFIDVLEWWISSYQKHLSEIFDTLKNRNLDSSF